MRSRISSPAGGAGLRAPAVEPAHGEDLEMLLDLLRTTVELESPIDYAERAGAPGHNRQAFLAHFGELDASLEAWEERVERVRAAPGALWEWFARTAARRGICEDIFALGPLVDRLAVLTVERSRRGQLRAPAELTFQRFRDTVGGEVFVSLYLAGQRVARVPCPGGRDLIECAVGAEQSIQRLFDDAQASEAAAEIENARDALLDLKSHLLKLLVEYAAADPIEIAPGCPFCDGLGETHEPL